jgi:hypothetical protein
LLQALIVFPGRKVQMKMNNIVLDLSKTQSKAIAQVFYSDVKKYCLENCERYIPWLIDEMRREKGKPPRCKPDYWRKGGESR